MRTRSPWFYGLFVAAAIVGCGGGESGSGTAGSSPEPSPTARADDSDSPTVSALPAIPIPEEPVQVQVPVQVPVQVQAPVQAPVQVQVQVQAPVQAALPGQMFGNNSLDILVLGSSKSINSSVKSFSPTAIASELTKMISGDASIGGDIKINVIARDIYTSQNVDTAIGSTTSFSPIRHHRHSLAQYYYWPEGKSERIKDLLGQNGNEWDYVVIAEDPHIISKLPGYYSFGVNKIAEKVVEGGAKPLLLMEWLGASNEEIAHFSDVTYRAADGAKVAMKVVPTAIAWNGLPPGEKDASSKSHPSPKGAYLAAAGIYSEIMNKKASSSVLATKAWDTKVAQDKQVRDFSIRSNPVSFVSPFKAAGIVDRTLNYNQTGSSSEAGIRAGLTSVVSQGGLTLVSGGTSPIEFNYGRGNKYFEANKQYKIDPAKYNFSLGFPMQDGNGTVTGNNSMLHGLDKRDYSGSPDTGTDLGLALWQSYSGELPYARTIPVRTLYAEMVDRKPGLSAYGDNWHMSKFLNRAIGAYMYTLLTNRCVFGTEPSKTLNNGEAWLFWMAQQVGHEAAWTLMHMKGSATECAM